LKIKKLYISSDHAGFELKSILVRSQIAKKYGFEFQDLGPENSERVDYPDYSSKVVAAVLADQGSSFGILICGSGQGMAMSANRHKGIRAALAWNDESAALSRAHNNANILCLGARLIEPALASRILESFLTTDFEGGRHTGRIEKF
jgi:ribose 5-phosphate isomerase B